MITGTGLDDRKFCYQLINHDYNKICDVLRFLKTKTQDFRSSEKKNDK